MHRGFLYIISSDALSFLYRFPRIIFFLQWIPALYKSPACILSCQIKIISEDHSSFFLLALLRIVASSPSIPSPSNPSCLLRARFYAPGILLSSLSGLFIHQLQHGCLRFGCWMIKCRPSSVTITRLLAWVIAAVPRQRTRDQWPKLSWLLKYSLPATSSLMENQSQIYICNIIFFFPYWLHDSKFSLYISYSRSSLV